MQQFLGETPIKDQGKQEYEENKEMTVNLFGKHCNKPTEEDKAVGKTKDCNEKALANSHSRY